MSELLIIACLIGRPSICVSRVESLSTVTPRQCRTEVVPATVRHYSQPKSRMFIWDIACLEGRAV